MDDAAELAAMLVEAGHPNIALPRTKQVVKEENPTAGLPLGLRGAIYDNHGSMHNTARLLDPSTHTVIMKRKHKTKGGEGLVAMRESLEAAAAAGTGFCIDLRRNTLGPEGMFAVKDSLMKVQTCTSLNLGLNMLGDRGAKTFAEALEVRLRAGPPAHNQPSRAGPF